MISKSKVLPIHSTLNKGKLSTLSYRNSSTRSTQDTMALIDFCHTDPSSIKIRPKSQMKSHSSNINTPL